MTVPRDYRWTCRHGCGLGFLSPCAREWHEHHQHLQVLSFTRAGTEVAA